MKRIFQLVGTIVCIKWAYQKINNTIDCMIEKKLEAHLKKSQTPPPGQDGFPFVW